MKPQTAMNGFEATEASVAAVLNPVVAELCKYPTWASALPEAYLTMVAVVPLAQIAIYPRIGGSAIAPVPRDWISTAHAPHCAEVIVSSTVVSLSGRYTV